MEETLARYPLIARLLVELFEARFEPGRGHQGATARPARPCAVSLTAIVPVAERR